MKQTGHRFVQMVRRYIRDVELVQGEQRGQARLIKLGPTSLPDFEVGVVSGNTVFTPLSETTRRCAVRHHLVDVIVEHRVDLLDLLIVQEGTAPVSARKETD